MATSKVELAIAHILRQLVKHRESTFSLTSRPPLFVAIQGPQGSGKTYLAAQLCGALRSPPHSLAVAAMSIDDLYLPHLKLVRLAETHRRNALLQGRGQPGTHDVELGKAILNELRHINDRPTEGVSRRILLPTYDKSLHDGAGDRSESVVAVLPPVDVVILEGWCVGFVPVTAQEIEKRWTKHFGEIVEQHSRPPCRKEDVLQLNELLGQYAELWKFFTVFIQIKTFDSSHSVIYKWRLEQEHQMKARNGGKGMDDAQVRSFVDRYIPSYVFFGDSMVPIDDETVRRSSWYRNGMAITIGEAREVLGVEYF